MKKNILFVMLLTVLLLGGCGAGNSAGQSASADSQSVVSQSGESGSQGKMIEVTVGSSASSGSAESPESSGNTENPESSGSQEETALSAAPIEGSETAQSTETTQSTEITQDEITQDETGSFRILDNFPLICQYPDLPTGCEITSLAMVLQYYGYPADKCDLSDNYLIKGETGTVSFYEAFEGDPRDASGSSFGCYAPVIVNTANAYLSAQGSSMQAIDITGMALSDLFTYVDQGMPVIVWGTYDCEEGHYSVTWNVDGQDLTWYTPEHCMVLIGYDEASVYIANPAYGEIDTYSFDLFNARYQELGQQAIIFQ